MSAIGKFIPKSGAECRINHVCHNFDKLTAQEGHHGNIEEVNYEEVAERLVRNAWVFC